MANKRLWHLHVLFITIIFTKDRDEKGKYRDEHEYHIIITIVFTKERNEKGKYKDEHEYHMIYRFVSLSPPNRGQK